MTDELGVPMLVGSSVYDHQPDRLHKYNSAILFQPSDRSYALLPQDAPGPVRRVHPADRHACRGWRP